MITYTAINSYYVGDRRIVIELSLEEVRKLICVDEKLLEDIINKVDTELASNLPFLN